MIVDVERVFLPAIPDARRTTRGISCMAGIVAPALMRSSVGRREARLKSVRPDHECAGPLPGEGRARPEAAGQSARFGGGTRVVNARSDLAIQLGPFSGVNPRRRREKGEGTGRPRNRDGCSGAPKARRVCSTAIVPRRMLRVSIGKRGWMEGRPSIFGPSKPRQRRRRWFSNGKGGTCGWGQYEGVRGKCLVEGDLVHLNDPERTPCQTRFTPQDEPALFVDRKFVLISSLT